MGTDGTINLVGIVVLVDLKLSPRTGDLHRKPFVRSRVGPRNNARHEKCLGNSNSVKIMVDVLIYRRKELNKDEERRVHNGDGSMVVVGGELLPANAFLVRVTDVGTI